MMIAMGMTQAGGPEVVKPIELEIPPIMRPNDVLVRVRAAGANPADWQQRKFGPPVYTGDERKATMTIFGMDGAGVVEAVGAAVTRVKVGDEVWYLDGGFGTRQGSYAQYKIVDDRYLALKPKSVDFRTAAAFPVALVTAWESLYERARLRAGQSVLVQGGAGGVGHFAVQLAKLRRARVAATVSSEAKAFDAVNLGADCAINYRQDDVGAALRAWSGQDGADVVFDTVGPGVFQPSFSLVAPYGTLVSCVVAAWPDGDTEIHEYRNMSLTWENVGAPQVDNDHARRVAQTAILEAAAELVDAGQLRVNLARTYPLAEAAEAQRVLEVGAVTGRIVLDIP